MFDERYRATEGARKLAEESLERAAAKTPNTRQAMRQARAEVYQAQEQLHRRLAEERAAQVQAARGRAPRRLVEGGPGAACRPTSEQAKKFAGRRSRDRWPTGSPT